MIIRKLNQRNLFIIAANLFPVYGVWFLGWSPTEAFIVYALETMIVGILTVFKLLIATLYRRKDTWYNDGQSSDKSGFFFIFFFIVHFGIFALVQTTIFSQTAKITPAGSGMTHFFFHWYSYINKDIAYMLFGFIVSYLATGFLPFLLKGDYKKMPMIHIMFQPYSRIFIQQFTVILGSLFLTIGQGKIFILVFALIKLSFEIVIDFDSYLANSVTGLKKNQPNNNSHS